MKITLVTREFFPLTGGLQALAAQLGQELQKKRAATLTSSPVLPTREKPSKDISQSRKKTR